MIFNTEQFQSQKKVLFLIAFLCVLLLVFLLFLFISNIKQPSTTPGKIPIPTQSIDTPISPISSTGLDVAAKNIHWINNKDLIYSYYDTSSLQSKIVKTDGTSQTVLATNLTFKMIDIIWSQTNNALILDYQYPNKTYLFTQNGQIEQLSFSGYGYSFSPDGNTIFYGDFSGSTPKAKVYNRLTRLTTSLPIDIPIFTNSYWSKDNRVLLYNNDIDVNPRASIQNFFLVNMATITTSQIPLQNASLVSWSPDGKKLIYLSTDGLYSYENSATSRIFPISTDSVAYTSYIWLDNSTILVLNTHTNPQLMKVNLTTGSSTQLTIPSISPEQFSLMDITPDKKTLAIGTQKDGILFITLP